MAIKLPYWMQRAQWQYREFSDRYQLATVPVIAGGILVVCSYPFDAKSIQIILCLIMIVISWWYVIIRQKSTRRIQTDCYDRVALLVYQLQYETNPSIFVGENVNMNKLIGGINLLLKQIREGEFNNNPKELSNLLRKYNSDDLNAIARDLDNGRYL